MKQFDLEQDIMGCWNIISDMKILSMNVMEDSNMTLDRTFNVLCGMEELYEMKFNKLWRTFEGFLTQFYKQQRELAEVKAELEEFREAVRKTEAANALIARAEALTPEDRNQPQFLVDLFEEEEERLRQEQIQLLEDED